MSLKSNINTIYLAGGCFWGMQKFFDQFKGIIETTVGYANGESTNPSYEEVCKNSGHAETLKIKYDKNKIGLKKILEYYFMVIDPTSVNKQGEDTGIQYRTGIYYENEKPKEIEEMINIQKNKYDKPIVVEVKKLDNFFDAEEYHQKYLDKNPSGYCYIPKEMFSIK